MNRFPRDMAHTMGVRSRPQLKHCPQLNQGGKEEKSVKLNLPQFNGHFRKYTRQYMMKEKGVSDEREATDI